GEPEAVDAVLRYYTAHIKYLSMYKGHINDDTQDRLKAKLVEAILKFRFDRQEVAKTGKAVKGKLCAMRP
ncbi:MAG: helix-turn-helix domain-containing protein, partial [Lachnospiraceae bacterium]|nr:helix-turn-helix domain-containing protein [Lachnospiraceae bacterium]